MSIFGRKDNIITYTVNKAVNTEMYISVQNREVVVNAPWYFTSNKIQQIVQEKKNWILSKMQEYEENFPNMQSVKIFGKYYDIQVKYQNIKAPELSLQEDYKIEIILPNKYKKVGNEQILKISIEKMYEQIANNEIENIMEKTRKMLKIAPDEYEIKQMSNVLATCIDGKITISPQLMQFKKEIIEYVFIHEFCHLKYKTHCKKFFEIIEKNVPDYKKYDNEIKNFEF